MKPITEEKPKRTRRTKEQIEADKLQSKQDAKLTGEQQTQKEKEESFVVFTRDLQQIYDQLEELKARCPEAWYTKRNYITKWQREMNLHFLKK